MISAPKCKLMPIDLSTILARSDTQLVIELEHPKYIPEFIERFQKYTYGLRLKTDGENYIAKTDILDPIRLPNISKIEDVCTEIFKRQPPFSKSLGILGYNDRFIALNVNHTVGYGYTLLKISELIQDPQPVQLPILPECPQVTFKDLIKDLDPEFIGSNLQQLTYFKSEKTSPSSPNAISGHNFIRDDITSYKSYDPQKKRLSGFNDYYWVGAILSGCSLMNKLSPFGCMTVIDIRNLINNPGIQHSNHYAFMDLVSPITKSMTVGDVLKNIRADFEYRRKRGDYKYMFLPNHTNRPDPSMIYSIVSNAGTFRIRSPIKDLIIENLCMNDKIDIFGWVGHSLINETTGKTTFTFGPHYSTNLINDRDALKISKGVQYFLKNIPKEMNIVDAFEEIREYQKKI
ncbi:hypothetical protein GPJ56_008851 [Histomonas meleagridis]|uniref:uncharacterized protein n=1 Tax=Histomonas meleagridis TaxID=135588 RepID=UPI00355ACD7D|nr:hypothetical protein GPJ56_008851 [Histomonas meleagridis]KAH0805356.1 hypothetical protein GO595_001738 [Histomonas meleagridis]